MSDREPEAAARRPTSSYIICASPRTGSYLLCHGLKSTGVAGSPTEHLSMTYQRHWQRRWGTRDYDEYLAKVFEIGTTENGVFGTKLHRHQLDHFVHEVSGERDVAPTRALEIVREVLPNPRWILLTRADRLRQAISYTRSMQTEIWWDADETPAPHAVPRPEAERFDVAQIEASMARLRTWETRWWAWFRAVGIEPLALEYEELVADRDGCVLRILDYLGQAVPDGFTLPPSPYRRQADATTEQWARRYQRLRQAKAERTLGAFNGIHRGEPMVVCGCGNSLPQLDRVNERVTIGVNDVGRAFDPSYLVVVDAPDRFAPDRWEHIVSTRADAVFTNQFLDIRHPLVVRMSLRTTPTPTLGHPTAAHVLERPWYSPYVALSVAADLGADPIGVIGVDFSDDHFFGPTGPYAGAKHLAQIDDQFRRLDDALLARGQRVFNLSTGSRLTAFPHLDIEDFDRLPPAPSDGLDRRPPLRVVVYDAYVGDPVGGLLARAIAAETVHAARYVHPPLGESVGGLTWPDLDWGERPDAVRAELARADIVLVVDGLVADEHQMLLSAVPAVAVRRCAGETFGVPGLALDSMRPGARSTPRTVPLPLPRWSRRLAPDDRDGSATVVAAPGGDRRALRRAIEAAAATAQVSLRLIDAEADAEADVAKFVRRADVVVDPEVDGPHLWSMVGLATGAVVVNSLAGDGAARRVLREMAGTGTMPFEHTASEGLEATLRRLLSRDRSVLAAEGAANRVWIDRHWSFGRQWERWWLPMVAAVAAAGRPRRSASPDGRVRG